MFSDDEILKMAEKAEWPLDKDEACRACDLLRRLHRYDLADRLRSDTEWLYKIKIENTPDGSRWKTTPFDPAKHHWTYGPKAEKKDLCKI